MTWVVRWPLVDGEDQLALLLIALAIVGLASTVTLVRGAESTGYIAVKERAGVSLVLSIFRVALAVLSGARLLRIETPPVFIGAVIVLLFIAIGLIDVVWGIAYRLGRFDREP